MISRSNYIPKYETIHPSKRGLIYYHFLCNETEWCALSTSNATEIKRRPCHCLSYVVVEWRQTIGHGTETLLSTKSSPFPMKPNSTVFPRRDLSIVDDSCKCKRSSQTLVMSSDLTKNGRLRGKVCVIAEISSLMQMETYRQDLSNGMMIFVHHTLLARRTCLTSYVLYHFFLHIHTEI